VKAVPPQRGRTPWRAEAHESHALDADLNRLRSVADSRVEQDPEGGDAPGFRELGASALAHARIRERFNDTRGTAPETACGCARGRKL